MNGVNNEQWLQVLLQTAREFYSNGVYVKSFQRPCGWVFISFENLPSAKDMDEQALQPKDFEPFAMIYDEYYGLTVRSIIDAVGDDWCFEKERIDW